MHQLYLYLSENKSKKFYKLAPRTCSALASLTAHCKNLWRSNVGIEVQQRLFGLVFLFLKGIFITKNFIFVFLVYLTAVVIQEQRLIISDKWLRYHEYFIRSQRFQIVANVLLVQVKLPILRYWRQLMKVLKFFKAAAKIVPIVCPRSADICQTFPWSIRKHRRELIKVLMGNKYIFDRSGCCRFT